MNLVRFGSRWRRVFSHLVRALISLKGKAVTVTGIDPVRISKGKVQEDCTNWDAMGMLQQLGVQQVAAAGA